MFAATPRPRWWNRRDSNPDPVGANHRRSLHYATVPYFNRSPEPRLFSGLKKEKPGTAGLFALERMWGGTRLHRPPRELAGAHIEARASAGDAFKFLLWMRPDHVSLRSVGITLGTVE